MNTTQPDNVKFHNTQTEIIHTCITATQRHLNITLDAAVQTTLADFKDTPEQLQSISTRIYSMHQDITRWMEWVGDCKKAVVSNTDMLLKHTQQQTDLQTQQKVLEKNWSNSIVL